MAEKVYRSRCCNAEVKMDGMPDFMGSKYVCTVYYVCLKCNKPCDLRVILTPKKKRQLDELRAILNLN